MTKGQKILTYATGFALGCLILAVLPREKSTPKRHPWHAQTPMEGTYPMTAADDTGREVLLDDQPRHFISLAPSITEILFAMEMGDHLMAVTKWCDFPEEAKALRDAGAQIGSMDQPDREMIAVYQPDLIFGTDLTPPEIYTAIENPPRTVTFVLKHDSMDDVLADIGTIGKITGVPGRALRLIQRLKTERAQVAASLQPFTGQSPKRVLFLLSIEENVQPGWAPGENTWVNNLLVETNAINVASELGKAWGEVSFESLLALNPEVLIIRDGETPAQQEELKERLSKLADHPIWKQVQAVQDGRIHVVPHGPLNIPGPRMMDAYRSIAEAVWQVN
jgi:iron complex transport system substrate-binding protein